MHIGSCSRVTRSDADTFDLPRLHATVIISTDMRKYSTEFQKRNSETLLNTPRELQHHHQGWLMLIVISTEF